MPGPGSGHRSEQSRTGSGRVCCRSRLLLATLPGTGQALRHLIGRNCPCRPRPLEAAGDRRRSRFPRSLRRALSAAELGAGRRTELAGGRGGNAGGFSAREGLPRGSTVRKLVPGCVSREQCRFPLPAVAARRQHLSTLAPPFSSSFGGAGSAAGGRGGRGTRRGEPVGCQASVEGTGGRREIHKERSERRRRRRPKRVANSGRQLPAAQLVPPVPPPPPPPRLSPKPKRQCGRAQGEGARAPPAPT